MPRHDLADSVTSPILTLQAALSQKPAKVTPKTHPPRGGNQTLLPPAVATFGATKHPPGPCSLTLGNEAGRGIVLQQKHTPGLEWLWVGVPGLDYPFLTASAWGIKCLFLGFHRAKP